MRSYKETEADTTLLVEKYQAIKNGYVTILDSYPKNRIRSPGISQPG